MLICNCTLAGTKACLQCSNYLRSIESQNFLQYNYPQYTPVETPEIFKSKKTIIKEYDQDGIVTKETIIQEDEGPDQTVYVDNEEWFQDSEDFEHGIN